MEVTNTQTAGMSTRAASAQAQSAAVLSSDFETFLQMLTAQARYQDPLEPIDSTEYAAQLAQFSMVEQQVLSNDLLSQLSAQLGSGSIGQLASWIGMEARSTAPVGFDGDTLTIFPTPAMSAEEAILIVSDTDGNEVQRKSIPVSREALTWDGRFADGTVLQTGTYSFAVESRTAGRTTEITAAEVFARITEARRQGSDTVLVLDGGATVFAEEISALRDAAMTPDHVP